MRLWVVGLMCSILALVAFEAAPAHAAEAKVVKRSSSKPAAAKRKVSKTVHRRPVNSRGPLVKSASVLVQDQATGAILFEKNAQAVVPIASITKLMTAMVVLDGEPSLTELLQVTQEDVDTLRGSSSRLRVGTRLSREDMLRLALMSSENRAASALARYYPGGTEGFVAAMNAKAEEIGLTDTHFNESTGLSAANVSSARDLARMVETASKYPLIREMSTMPDYTVRVNGRTVAFRNTNMLVNNPAWEIGVSKTGFIREAGKCLVMQAWLGDKPLIIVLLDSVGRLTRVADANRIRKWIESAGLVRRNDG